MTPIFWAFVALDAILLVTLIILGIVDPGANDGGREMSMIFFVIFPAMIVGAGALLFIKTESSLWRTVALIIVAGPALLLGGVRVRSAVIDYQIHQNSRGSGYFSNRGVKRAAEAVVRHDVAALAAVDRSVDVNAKGDGGMTLMELAVDGAYESPPSPASLEVIRALIARGADPSTGLETATKSSDGTVLRMLLDAGAKTDYAKYKSPVVFTWLGVMPDANFTALLDHGLDVNLNGGDDRPLIVAAAESDRWNFVLLRMDRGADVSRPAGRLAELVQSRQESTSERPPEMKKDIARVDARLRASKPIGSIEMRSRFWRGWGDTRAIAIEAKRSQSSRVASGWFSTKVLRTDARGFTKTWQHDRQPTGERFWAAIRRPRRLYASRTADVRSSPPMP